MFPRLPFFYWGNLGNSNHTWTNFFKDNSKHNYWNRMFFSFVWLFRRFHQAFILWNSFEYFQQIFNFFEKYPKCFWTLPHEKILFDFSPNHKILSFGKNFFPTLKEKSFCQRKKAFAKQKDFSFRVGKKLLLKQKDFSLWNYCEKQKSLSVWWK